jgi:hypothetical protein
MEQTRLLVLEDLDLKPRVVGGFGITQDLESPPIRHGVEADQESKRSSSNESLKCRVLREAEHPVIRSEREDGFDLSHGRIKKLSDDFLV